MYTSAIKSNLTRNLVFVQNGIDRVRRNVTMHTYPKNNGASYLHLNNNHTTEDSSAIGTMTNHNLDASAEVKTILFSDLMHLVIQHEEPKRIIIKMDIELCECRALLGITQIK